METIRTTRGSALRRLAIIGSLDLLLGSVLLLIIAALLSQAQRWSVKYPDTAAFIATQIGSEMASRGFDLNVIKEQALVQLPALFPNEKDQILDDCVPADSNELPPCIPSHDPGAKITPARFLTELADVLSKVLPEFAPGTSRAPGHYKRECQRQADGLPCNGALVVVYIEGHADRRFFASNQGMSNDSLSLARALSVYKAVLNAESTLGNLGRQRAIERPALESDGNDILTPAGFGCRRPIFNLSGATGFKPTPQQKDEGCPSYGASSGEEFENEFRNRRVDLRVVVSLQGG
jgi:hypothetical protein